MTPENIAIIAQLLGGPASSVFICVLGGFAAYKIFVEKILPQSEARFERLFQEHAQDREVFRDAVKHLGERIIKIEDDVTDIKNKLGA
jgi:hypothetical protein